MQNNTIEQAHHTLTTAVAREVADGWRTITVSPTQVVLEKGRRTSHGLHLVLSLLTGGFWLLVWPVVAFVNRRRSLVLTVDSLGNLNRSA